MAEDLLRYDMMIESALRDVVRQTMEKVADQGLLGDHHFYISFLTRHPDVEIPDHLLKQYPEEMTIVLQHQFYNLKVDQKSFSVGLSFNNVREKLTIPFAAITTFADPAVNFALQFQMMHLNAPDDDLPPTPPEDGPGKKSTESGEEKRGEVISLDRFRKK